jgi:acid stress chaperone HdeB
MSKSTAILCLVAIVASAQPLSAQVTIDLAKVTCNQWVGYKITNPQNIALWLSGFQHGRRGDTMVDTQRLNSDNEKLRDFCLVNPTVPVMEAAEKVLVQPK